MPIYEYQCQHCQTTFEVQATFKEKTAGLRPECPECHRRQARQVLTAGLVLVHSQGDSAPACGCGTGGGCCGGGDQ